MPRLSHKKSKGRQARQQQKAAAEQRDAATVIQKFVLRKCFLPKRAKARAFAKALAAYIKSVIAARVSVKAPVQARRYSQEELDRLVVVADSFLA